jgi:hypothetical protein
LRYFSGLPGFLRRSISPDQARAALQRRFEQRAADFLTFARRAIYQRPGNPYRQLLALAGCEAGDLARLVEAEGIEARWPAYQACSGSYAPGRSI